MQRHPRLIAPLCFSLLLLSACSQLGQEPTTNIGAAAATQIPLPAFATTFESNLTRGFWFQAPVDFRITGLKVPDEAGKGLQNVEVFKLSSAPPEYPGTATDGQVFYKTGVPSGEVIKTNLSFATGDYVAILGAAGDASTMANSYASEANFDSSVLGEPVVLRRFLTQSNIVASGGNQPYSAEAAGNIARIEVYVDDGTAEPTPDSYTLDFEKASANRIIYSVKVGAGVVYGGEGSAITDPVRVDGMRYLKGKRLGGNQAKVISMGKNKVLTVVQAGTNTPNPDGGQLEVKPSQAFGGPSKGKNGLVTLKTLTIHNVQTNGAFLTLYGDGVFRKRIPLAKATVQTLELDEPGVGFIQVSVNNAFSIDNVGFEVALPK